MLKNTPKNAAIRLYGNKYVGTMISSHPASAQYDLEKYISLVQPKYVAAGTTIYPNIVGTQIKTDSHFFLRKK
jgi:hypothetical protein